MPISRKIVAAVVTFLIALLLACGDPAPSTPSPTSDRERKCTFYGHPPKPICYK